MSSGLEPSEEPSANRDPKDAAVRQALVESHQDLARFLQRRLGNADEAEDVLQRFILKAIERSEDLRDVKAVRGWLSRVLATTIVDHQRAAGHTRDSQPDMRKMSAHFPARVRMDRCQRGLPRHRN